MKRPSSSSSAARERANELVVVGGCGGGGGGGGGGGCCGARLGELALRSLLFNAPRRQHQHKRLLPQYELTGYNRTLESARPTCLSAKIVIIIIVLR